VSSEKKPEVPEDVYDRVLAAVLEAMQKQEDHLRTTAGRFDAEGSRGAAQVAYEEASAFSEVRDWLSSPDGKLRIATVLEVLKPKPKCRYCGREIVPAQQCRENPRDYGVPGPNYCEPIESWEDRP